MKCDRNFCRFNLKAAALLVRDYHWELLPDQNLEMVMGSTPHPRDGLRVNFQCLSIYPSFVTSGRVKLGAKAERVSRVAWLRHAAPL
jgi:hypothetical protein